jgi:hypothetical protein
LHAGLAGFVSPAPRFSTGSLKIFGEGKKSEYARAYLRIGEERFLRGSKVAISAGGRGLF